MGECIVGTGICWNENNKAIRQLLHFVVSDVSDDVRRTTVLALGFVGYSKPEQLTELNDKERVVAAMENPNLHQLVNEGLHSSKL
nr:26S proteasome non-ATPase regulatory subunit 1 homolog A-like [Tanacetum cinerariifolium]